MAITHRPPHDLNGLQQVLVRRCDITVGGDVMSALDAAALAAAGLPPVRGILHAEGLPQGGADEEEAAHLQEQLHHFLATKV